MKVAALHHAACMECWHGYFGEHADWCSKSTTKACDVCGNLYQTDRGAGRCTWDHTAYTAATTEKAA